MTAEEIRIAFYNDGDSRAYDQDEFYLMKKYAKLKCQELLEIVAEEAQIKQEIEYIHSSVGYGSVHVIDKDSILNAVDLDEFIK